MVKTGFLLSQSSTCTQYIHTQSISFFAGPLRCSVVSVHLYAEVLLHWRPVMCNCQSTALTSFAVHHQPAEASMWTCFARDSFSPCRASCVFCLQLYTCTLWRLEATHLTLYANHSLPLEYFAPLFVCVCVARRQEECLCVRLQWSPRAWQGPSR